MNRFRLQEYFTLPRNVWILTLAQAMFMTLGSVVVFVGGLAGRELTGDPAYSTLPVAALSVGTAVFVLPVNILLKTIGRKRAMLSLQFLGVGFCLLTAYSLKLGSFPAFTFSLFLLGINLATIMQFRFAAIESVGPEMVPLAASTVLLGGIVAAWLGPELALYGIGLLETRFAGTFVLLALIFMLGTLLLLFFNDVEIKSVQTDEAPRSLREIAANPVFWLAIGSAAVAYAVMSFVMTATPVSMNKIDGFTLRQTKTVIQAHVLSMFLPSLFSGALIRLLGIRKMLVSGLLIYVVCMSLALSGHDWNLYLTALIALGIGWNFMFVAGTSLLPSTYRGEERYRVQGLNDFLVLSLQSLASLTGGWVVFRFGWETLITITLPVLALYFLLWYRTSRHIQ